MDIHEMSEKGADVMSAAIKTAQAVLDGDKGGAKDALYEFNKTANSSNSASDIIDAQLVLKGCKDSAVKPGDAAVYGAALGLLGIYSEQQKFKGGAEAKVNLSPATLKQLALEATRGGR